ncbi:hypothetical protein [Pseudomonas fluorescens]|uniref:hypothetical protein n=1 Tax=Pseudomonas fluorescens TaxID=294 RepID=UPI003D00A1B5
MATPSLTAASNASASNASPQLDKKPGVLTAVVFFAVLTLPAAIMLSGSLYWLFTQLF